MAVPKDFTLESSFTCEEGTIFLTGMQALARIPIDQHRADRRRGLNTATLISGYRGSPIAGLDLLLERSGDLLREHQIVFIPAVNEDLGATAIFGSQLAHSLPQPRYDGVLGMWYGKGPGVDRSGDSFKHANYAGIGANGGVLVVAGDDPNAKSSTLPTHSEVALYDALMPTLYPGSVQELLDLGRLGFELSRYSGLWVGFKVVTNVADGFESVEVSPDRPRVTLPEFTYRGKPWRYTQNANLLAPYSLMQEQEIHEGRMEAARRFVAANDLNRITVNPPDARLGIVAAGKTYYDVRHALLRLGLTDDLLRRYGIRLLKIDIIFPLEPGVIREFANGLEEVFVVEEKRAFIETFIRDALYPLPDRPRVIGKRDARDQMLVPAYGELDSDRVAQLLAPWLKQHLPADFIDHGLAATNGVTVPIDIPILARTPHFCSGCSHNRSTVLPEDSIAGGGIGCHTLAMLMDRSTYGVTQMGGEGAQWVGASPFSDMPHLFQNVGDGTFFHSGSLAVRQAVAAGVNITYKLLYNSAVGMTGGQDADGAIDVPAVTRALRAEGVASIIVMSDHPDKYRAEASWADHVEIWHRDRLDEAQRRLRETPGVTVLIYDQHCMAELRRMRRRGTAPEPPARIYINEAVCEGCGDCGVKSNCLSVFPVETEFGRKTQIHQSSCNKDYSCADGDCPAFLSIIPGETARQRKTIAFNVDIPLPEPPRRGNGSGSIYMMGIGGTGVVTVNQVLGVAALLDGKHIEGLDQTGLSQKGGSVVSHLKIMDSPHDTSNMIMAGEADCYLVFDLLTGIAPNNLRRAAGEKTIAVISTSQIPTGAMVRKTDVHFPPVDALTTALDRHTRAQDNVYLDADALAESLFGSHLPANIIVLGAAYQAGGLPVSAESIERSIALNGVAVAMNTQAFRVGRRLVAEPEWAQSLTAAPAEPSPDAQSLSAEARALIDETAVGGSVRALLNIRIPELIAYQDLAYARRYAAFVRHVWEAEQRVMTGESQLTEAVARYLFKLMAFKDEYEVARLHLRLVRSKALDEAFGSGAQATYLLHPPFLRALGVRKKIRLGRWFDPVYTLLVAMRRLRGTPLDLFGYTAVRRAERKLIDDYRALIEKALSQLSAENYAQVVRVAALPDMIRGYEDIKLGSVQRFWDEVHKLGFAD